MKVEIVKRSDQAKAFVVLPKRWIVERTLAWLGRCRQAGQGLGMPQPQGARLPPPRLHPPHAAKTMQSHMMFPDKLLEADFEDSAYGYRPRRSAVDAVKEAHRPICRGYTDVDADLSKYLDVAS